MYPRATLLISPLNGQSLSSQFKANIPHYIGMKRTSFIFVIYVASGTQHNDEVPVLSQK